MSTTPLQNRPDPLPFVPLGAITQEVVNRLEAMTAVADEADIEPDAALVIDLEGARQ